MTSSLISDTKSLFSSGETQFFLLKSQSILMKDYYYELHLACLSSSSSLSLSVRVSSSSSSLCKVSMKYFYPHNLATDLLHNLVQCYQLLLRRSLPLLAWQKDNYLKLYQIIIPHSLSGSLHQICWTACC